MKSIKHNKKFIVFALLVLFVLFIVFIIFHFDVTDYYNRHIARIPHNTGEILLNINDTSYKINNNNATLIYKDDTSNIDLLDISEGRFKKSEGDYGIRKFELFLLPEFCTANINKDLKQGITFEFGYITTNNWHKNNIELKINIKTLNNDKYKVLIIQEVEGDDNGSTSQEYVIIKPFVNDIRLKIFERFL